MLKRIREEYREKRDCLKGLENSTERKGLIKEIREEFREKRD